MQQDDEIDDLVAQDLGNVNVLAFLDCADIPRNARPVFLDRRIWEIAKRVESDGPDKLLYWATVVRLYRDMGGRIEFRTRE